MNFLEKMNEYASENKIDAVEIPLETSDIREDVSETSSEMSSDVSSDETEETPNLHEMVESGEIHKSWTRVNTSNWCGCNNACFHSCYNIG